MPLFICVTNGPYGASQHGHAACQEFRIHPKQHRILGQFAQLPVNVDGIAIGALGNAVLAISLTFINPRIGFLLAQVFVGGFALLIWQSASLPWILLGYFLLGGFRAARPLAMAQARELVHTSQMGLTYGMMETIYAAVAIITPPLAGFLYKIDPAASYPIALVLIAVSVLSSFLFMRRPAHA